MHLLSEVQSKDVISQDLVDILGAIAMTVPLADQTSVMPLIEETLAANGATDVVRLHFVAEEWVDGHLFRGTRAFDASGNEVPLSLPVLEALRAALDKVLADLLMGE